MASGLCVSSNPITFCPCVQAFISRILMTMEAVYMRNKTAAARLAQRRQQAEAAKTKSEADNDSTKAESQASPGPLLCVNRSQGLASCC